MIANARADELTENENYRLRLALPANPVATTDVTTAAVGMLRFYERYDVDKYDIPGAPLHDPCVIAYLVDPSLFNGHAAHVAVDTVTEATIGNTYEIDDGAPNATVMTDSTATFTEDSLIGLTIRNTTDASEGVIIDNDETTVTVRILTGGTDNDWDASDAYVIMVFGEIVDDDFTSRGSGDVEYLDKFYFHREPNSNRIFIPDQWSSGEVDPTDPIENTNESVLAYNALQFLAADDATDEKHPESRAP